MNIMARNETLLIDICRQEVEKQLFPSKLRPLAKKIFMHPVSMYFREIDAPKHGGFSEFHE